MQMYTNALIYACLNVLKSLCRGKNLNRGKSGNPTVETLEKIAEALGVEVVELFKPETGDFTAFIDHRGNLYRCDTIAQTRALLDRLDGVE